MTFQEIRKLKKEFRGDDVRGEEEERGIEGKGGNRPGREGLVRGTWRGGRERGGRGRKWGLLGTCALGKVAGVRGLRRAVSGVECVLERIRREKSCAISICFASTTATPGITAKRGKMKRAGW